MSISHLTRRPVLCVLAATGALTLLAAPLSASAGISSSVIPHDSVHGIGTAPVGIAIDQGLDRAFVTNSGDGTVSVIDTESNTVIGVIPHDAVAGIGDRPSGIAVDQKKHRGYVANTGSGTVSVIDTSTAEVVSVIGHDPHSGIGNEPVGVAVDEARDRAYVTEYGDGQVAVIDTSAGAGAGAESVIAILPFDIVRGIGHGPAGIALDGGADRAFVANSGDDTVSVIDTRTSTVSLVLNDLSSAVGHIPRGIAIDAKKHHAFVSNAGDDTVTVIDTRTLAADRLLGPASAIGDEPSAVAVDENRRRVYVANAGGDTVTVLDADDYTAVAVLDAGDGIGSRPSAVAVEQDSGDAFAANETDGTVTALSDGGSVAPAITTRTLPDAHQGSSYSAPIRTVGIVSPTFEIAAPKGESLPAGLTIDRTTGVIQGTITAAPGAYHVTIVASQAGIRVASATLTLRVVGPGA